MHGKNITTKRVPINRDNLKQVDLRKLFRSIDPHHIKERIIAETDYVGSGSVNLAWNCIRLLVEAGAKGLIADELKQQLQMTDTPVEEKSDVTSMLSKLRKPGWVGIKEYKRPNHKKNDEQIWVIDRRHLDMYL